MKAPLPSDEQERLEALRTYGILDTDPEPEFDDITLLAARICGTPFALISLIDEHRQWFKSKIGKIARESSREVSFCAHGILQSDVFVVEDAGADRRFADNPLVTGGPALRFYAGSPLITPEGFALGTLCVADVVPRSLNAGERAALQALSRQVVTQLELRRTLQRLQQTEKSLAERTLLAALDDDVRSVLARPATLAEMLHSYCASIVQRLDGAFARIWVLDESSQVLELQASAGMYTHLDGPHSRVPVGKLKIGLIAEERKPHLTNHVVGDLRIGDQEWARREGMVAFAGYPLLAEDRLVGVVAMFARHPLTELTLTALAALARNIAGGIERQRWESELLASKQFLRFTLDALSAHIAILDETGTIIEVNAAWLRFASQNNFSGPHCGVGDNYLNVCTSATGDFTDEAPVVANGIRAVMAGLTEEFCMEYPCHSPWEQRWFIVRATRFECGGAVRAVVAHENITARRRAESLVIESQERYRSLIENARDAIFTIALDGTFSSLNPAAETIGGLSRTEWIGKPFTPMVHPEDLPLAREMFARVLRGERPPVHELRGNPSLKRPALMEMTLAAQKDEHGKIIGVLGIGRDITERKRLEAGLFESQKLETVGKLAGGVAHEFNSILTTILVQSELLMNELSSGSRLAEYVREISDAADRAAGLTRQLLAYGRKQFLRPETLDLNRVIANLKSMLQPILGGRVEVKYALAVRLKTVRADAGQIEQVILNLVMNARDAMPEGGLLRLETAHVSLTEESADRHPELQPGDYVLLTVTDSGCGMSDAVKARAFEPFFSTKGVGRGTGLGLSTCYGIIKQSGGHISLLSEAGRGTTFKIYLPPAEPPPPPVAVTGPGGSDLPRGTETVLLVEDDPAIREITEILLKRLGYTVLSAADHIEALELCRQDRASPPVLPVIDIIVMPPTDGGAVAGQMLALQPRSRLLYISDYAAPSALLPGALLAGGGRLQKPFMPSALANKLRELLDQPRR